VVFWFLLLAVIIGNSKESHQIIMRGMS
jgi:hypothetical protein